MAPKQRRKLVVFGEVVGHEVIIIDVIAEFRRADLDSGSCTLLGYGLLPVSTFNRLNTVSEY